ncbi:MAG: 4-hydroxythreonine-4-phosphate dehydrogenase PdxA [Candidatus Aminicenantaceae bacterium]
MTRPRIGITLGDPGGIGPEVTLKSLGSAHLPTADYTLFGPRSVITREADHLGLSAVLEHCRIQDAGTPQESFVLGEASAHNGRASFVCVEHAVDEARKGTLQAVVTAPISKHSWNLAGVSWAGHTDYLEQFWPGAIMSFFSDRLNLALYTHHLPLREALQRIRKEPLQDFLLRLHRQTVQILGEGPELLVSGLNPHAGEGGLLGTEEREEIIPALEAVRGAGVPVSGPYPPDIVPRMALDRPDRLLVSLYHDQGLVAFKLIAFDTGVNMTLGLPFIRTSPDHGTAFDIAGQGKADPRSMLAAVQLAHRSASPHS